MAYLVRAKHVVVGKAGVKTAIQQVMSPEGAVIRAVDAPLRKTALMFKVKREFDLDVRIVKVIKTAGGAEVYVVSDREGNIVGKTYGQTYLRKAAAAKGMKGPGPGDIVRVNVGKVNRHWSSEKGRWTYHWFRPTVAPPEMQAGKAKGADPQARLEEIFMATQGKRLSREELRRKPDES